jgi:hypothetical protein
VIRRGVAPADHRRAMRERGYRDGRAGKPATFADAHYQVGWRRGREARAAESAGQQ